MRGGNRKSSATDGGKSNWRHNQPLVPAELSARRPGTSAVEVNGPRYRDASLLENSVCQHAYLELDSLRYTQQNVDAVTWSERLRWKMYRAAAAELTAAFA